uniref:2c protein n=1 Tax=Tobacco rattle virus TaxID=12295 RepID=A0A145XW07_9VIRU|nr:2c protein [Tobacco rattle virus]
MSFNFTKDFLYSGKVYGLFYKGISVGRLEFSGGSVKITSGYIAIFPNYAPTEAKTGNILLTNVVKGGIRYSYNGTDCAGWFIHSVEVAEISKLARPLLDAICYRHVYVGKPGLVANYFVDGDTNKCVVRSTEPFTLVCDPRDVTAGQVLEKNLSTMTVVSVANKVKFKPKGNLTLYIFNTTLRGNDFFDSAHHLVWDCRGGDFYRQNQ